MDKNLKRQVVPWKNPAEFIKVYECAYADDLSKNRWAVEQIAVWETRCWPSLPPAVEATLLLVRSKIQDFLYRANKSFHSAQDVEILYSTAVVRFVNLLIEKDQNSKSKKSIYTLAAEKNIPLWIIEIRHNATHGFQPTLSILRMAYETIMPYIERVFWIPQKARVCAVKKTFDETPMVKLFHHYKVKQHQVVAAAFVAAAEKKKEKEAQTSAVLLKMEYFLSRHESRIQFLKIIARDFVTLDDVKALVSKDDLFMDVNMEPTVTLPISFQQFYYPLIKLIHKHDSISDFLVLLLLAQDKRDYVILQKVVDHTVIYVFQLKKAAKELPKEQVMPFVCKGVALNLYKLLYACVKGASHTVRVVFEWLVMELNMTDFVPELNTMMSIRLGAALQGEPEEGVPRKQRKYDITFTVEDLEEDVLELADKRNYRVKGPWSLSPIGIDWASIPIGHVFNPVDRTKKEVSKREDEASSSAENNESLYAHASEESQPIITPQPENFIFKECPKRSSMLYLKKK